MLTPQTDLTTLCTRLSFCAALPQGGFYSRGYLQPHPNGSSMFVHRVGPNKFDPANDDLKPITHATVPSCLFYREKASQHAEPIDRWLIAGIVAETERGGQQWQRPSDCASEL